MIVQTGMPIVWPNPIGAVFVKDEFIGGNTTSGSIGEMGWTSNSGGASTYTHTGTPVANAQQGTLRLGTSTMSATVAAIMCPSTASVAMDPSSDAWEILWIMRSNHGDANTNLRIGLTDSALSVAQPTNGIYFEKLTSDTNWFGVCRSGGSQTRTDTSQAHSTTGYHRFLIRRVDASTIGFTYDDTAEVTVAATVPTADLNPWAMVTNTTGANKTIDVDYFHMAITSLSR